jgi:PAS domain S-box-containing protein
LAFTALALLGTFSVRLGEQAVRRQVEARLGEGSTAAAALVGGQMRDLSVLVESYAARPSLVAALADGNADHFASSTVSAVLSGLRGSLQGIAVAFLADASGRLADIQPDTPSIIGQDFSFRDWYRGATASGQTYVSEAYQTAATGNARVVAAAALVRGASVAGQPGPVRGLLVAAFDLSTVQGFVDRFAAADAVRLTVTDQRGTVVAAPGASSNATALVSDRARPGVAEALAGRSGMLVVNDNGQRTLSAYTPIPDIGWTVRAEVPSRAAYASAIHLRSTVVVIASALAVVLLGGLGLLWVTLRRHERAEAHRAESEAFLDSIIENIPDMVFIKDAENLRFVRVNRAGEDMLGKVRQELIGRSDFDLYPGQRAALSATKDREALATQHVLETTDESMETSDGERRIVHTKKISVRDTAGEPRYLLGISEDVTDRHAADRALASAKDEAEQANRAKSEFLSRMSHELRTPLNAILGFAQLLELDELTEDQMDSVEQILRGGRHLLALINEVLDISRIETGSLALSTEAVDVADILAETVALSRPLAGEREITIEVEPLEPSVRAAQADHQRVKQILLNLASNAVKYNRVGGRVSFACKPAAPGRLRIEVTDTGPGLDADQVKRLFTPFDRLGAEMSGVEGTGIGLALSRRLAEAMGGRIDVSSTPGQGSTFCVDLPVAEPIEQPEEINLSELDPSSTASVGGVLYIEDNPANLRLMERVLAQRGGLSLVTSTMGAPALALARRHRPDVILLDLHLPDIDGDAVLGQLVADPNTTDIPVVMVTADATPAQIQRLLDAGASDYLTKPLDIARFLRLLDQFLGARRS